MFCHKYVTKYLELFQGLNCFVTLQRKKKKKNILLESRTSLLVSRGK